MSYVPRLVENRITQALNAAGAVYLRGVKASGKTSTAMQFAKSHINLQENPNSRKLAEIDPEITLAGETPRLIDEWQEVPNIWNGVKIESDKRKAKGQFILTGSATKKPSTNLHSGAGRFITIDMSTLTWVELGYSNSSASLADLLAGNPVKPAQNQTKLGDILQRLVTGGWPGLIGENEGAAILTNNTYLDLLLADDISRVSGIQRNKQKAESVLTSLARNIATPVEVTTIARDTQGGDISSVISRQSAGEYLDDLENLMILVNQPAWNVHIRSSASLRVTPKRHLIDPSLACAALGLSSDKLLEDLRFTGFLFESLVFHDLTVYAGENDARLSYYRDSSDSEVDIIAEKRDGSWAAFEVKLGDNPEELDQAAQKLLDFAANIDTSKSRKPNSLNIITGTGYAYTRSDGVNILPLSVIGV